MCFVYFCWFLSLYLFELIVAQPFPFISGFFSIILDIANFCHSWRHEHNNKKWVDHFTMVASYICVFCAVALVCVCVWICAERKDGATSILPIQLCEVCFWLAFCMYLSINHPIRTKKAQIKRHRLRTLTLHRWCHHRRQILCLRFISLCWLCVFVIFVSLYFSLSIDNGAFMDTKIQNFLFAI